MTRSLLFAASAILAAGCGREHGTCDGLIDAYAYFPLDGAGRWTYQRSDVETATTWTADLDPERWRLVVLGLWVQDLIWTVDCAGEPDCDPAWTRLNWVSADPGEAVTLLRWEESGYPLFRTHIPLLAECAVEGTEPTEISFDNIVDGLSITSNSAIIDQTVSMAACPATPFDAGADCVHLKIKEVFLPMPTEMYFARGVGMVAFTDETGSYHLTDFEWEPSSGSAP